MQLDQGLPKGDSTIIALQGTTPWVVSGGSSSYTLYLEEASATITYIGEADPGSATSASTWRIKRLDSSSGLVVTWANGTADFDKVWNNRASYSYS